jgi:hypothetical protein
MNKASLLILILSLQLLISGCKAESESGATESPSKKIEIPANPNPSNPSDPSTSTARSFSEDVFFVGHSLVGPNMPVMLKRLIESQSASSGDVDAQVINGSPLSYNWDNSSSGSPSDSRAVIPMGNHETLVITEAVPLLNHTTYSNTNQLALQFYNLSLNANPSSRVFLYETWHCLNSGTPTGCEWDEDDANPWRQRLTDDLPKWEAIADHVNTNNGPTQPEMLIVPAGQAMAKIYDEIAAGQVPGITSINQLFSDDIHPNDLGFYFVSAVQYATLYSRTPVGLPRALINEYGTAYTAPSAALALKMQEIAWEVVCDYSRSGVICSNP